MVVGWELGAGLCGRVGGWTGPEWLVEGKEEFGALGSGSVLTCASARASSLAKQARPNASARDGRGPPQTHPASPPQTACSRLPASAAQAIVSQRRAAVAKKGASGKQKLPGCWLPVGRRRRWAKGRYSCGLSGAAGVAVAVAVAAASDAVVRARSGPSSPRSRYQASLWDIDFSARLSCGVLSSREV